MGNPPASSFPPSSPISLPPFPLLSISLSLSFPPSPLSLTPGPQRWRPQKTAGHRWSSFCRPLTLPSARPSCAQQTAPGDIHNTYTSGVCDPKKTITSFCLNSRSQTLYIHTLLSRKSVFSIAVPIAFYMQGSNSEKISDQID